MLSQSNIYLVLDEVLSGSSGTRHEQNEDNCSKLSVKKVAGRRCFAEALYTLFSFLPQPARFHHQSHIYLKTLPVLRATPSD